MTWLLVVLGGMVGAPLRYLVDVAVTARVGPGFPFGTLVANVAACVLLGEEGRAAWAAGYVLVSIVIGLAALLLGLSVG